MAKLCLNVCRFAGLFIANSERVLRLFRKAGYLIGKTLQHSQTPQISLPRRLEGQTMTQRGALVLFRVDKKDLGTLFGIVDRHVEVNSLSRVNNESNSRLRLSLQV